MIALAAPVFVASALALVGTRVAAVPVLWAWSRLTHGRSPAAERALARWHPAILLLPLALGLLVPLGAMSAGCHCVLEPGPHLCPAHPALAWPWVPYAALAWLVAGRRPLRALVALVRGARRGRALGRLVSGGTPVDDGVHLVDLGAPNALTLGLLRPVIVADRRWWATLEPRERAIVRAHEQAHGARRDLLTYAVARALAAWLPARLADPLVARWLDRAEQCADRHAAATVGDPLAVAEFLIRQRRLGAAPATTPRFHGGSFARRVTALADHQDGGEPLASDLDAMFAVGLVALPPAVFALAPELHGLAEAALRLLHS